MTRTGRLNHGNGHSYVLDDRKTPGVTTVLNDGLPKPALITWAASMTAEFVCERITKTGDATELIADLQKMDLEDVARGRKPRWPADGTFSRTALLETLKAVRFRDKDGAANRGTEVHTLAEHLIAGEEVTVPEELEGHVDSFIRFVTDWQPRNPISEFVVGNRRHGYMGTGDIIATLADGRTWLLDYKTNRSGPFQEVALQLAAYRHAEFIIGPTGEEEPMPPVDCCGVVWLRGDGYDLYEVRADAAVFRTFLYVQQVARFCNADRTEYISPALRPEEKAA